MQIQCVQPVLMSSDIGASVAFYRRMGFELEFQGDPEAPAYAVVAREGACLHLQRHDRSHWACSHDQPTHRFVVADLDGLYEVFRASGAICGLGPTGSPWAAPAVTPWGTREFHLRDPDGNGLQFYRGCDHNVR